MAGYIYILREREFIRMNENVYKIGQTGKSDIIRFKQYPNDSELITSFNVQNHTLLEKVILNNFKKEFIHRKDIGNEYFEGKLDTMLGILYRICVLNQKPKICSKYAFESESGPESEPDVESSSMLSSIRASTEITHINTPDDTKLDKFIRTTLGQDFENPKYDEHNKPIHERIIFDARCDESAHEHNKSICELFKNELNQYRAVLYTHKGCGYAYLVSKYYYDSVDYWNEIYWYNGSDGNLELPYKYKLLINAIGTIQIISTLIYNSKLK